MQLTIFSKKHSLTSKGHHEGQKLLKMGIVRFIDPIRKKYKLYKFFFGFINKLKALLMLKMVLQYEFGQIVFKWFMIKNHLP